VNRLTDIINLLMQRELRAFKRELEAYPDDASVWRSAPGVENPGGTFALHVAGNLQHFVGAQLGRSGYVRDRDSEFRRRDVPRVEMYAEIDRAMRSVEQTLTGDLPTSFPEDFPEQIAGKTIRTDVWLMHLVAHLAYHLGQLDYHRRLTTGAGSAVDDVSVRELPDAG
jgi:hypothetical protein